MPSLLPALGLLLTTVAADWPQFLGPDRDGSAPAITWDEAAPPPEVRWRTPLGPGYGGAAIRGGEVFLLDREAGEQDVLRVLDLATGEERWRVSGEAKGKLNFAGSRTVPVVTDDLVLSVGGLGHVRAFDRKARTLLWTRHLKDDLGGRPPMFGWSGAPVLEGGNLLVTPLGRDVGMVALDPRNGETRWRTGFVGHSHSTPAVLDLLGRRQIVFASTEAPASGQDRPAPSWISGFDPEDGSLLWRTELTFSRLPVPPPVRVADDRIFLTGGYRAGSVLLGLREDDAGETETEELFRLERGAQVHAPVRVGDHLYFVANENWNHARPRRPEGGLVCLSLDGVERWRTGKDPYFGRGGIVRVGELLLVQDGMDAALHLIRANPERFEPLLRIELVESPTRRDLQTWAPLAVSGRTVLARGEDELVCVRL